HNRTLIAHLAEPDSCWKPPNAASPDYSYYKEHPGEYAYTHPEWPSKGAILAARDHLLAANPKLRVIGAHLGSMETNVDDIAQRFDLYPNFAVDMAARIPYFMLQPREKVREFLLKYQDRVLYATDRVVFPQSKRQTRSSSSATRMPATGSFSRPMRRSSTWATPTKAWRCLLLCCESCFTITPCVGSRVLG